MFNLNYFRNELSDYDLVILSAEEQDALARHKRVYYEAKLVGDRATMRYAHKLAERIRNKHGYTGGHRGDSFERLVPYEPETIYTSNIEEDEVSKHECD